MKKIIIIILSTISAQVLTAHNPAVASYYIIQQEGQWQMRTEFAWSLRNALVMNFPFLEENDKVTDDVYTDCVKDYLDVNLDMKLDGHKLEYSSIRQIPGSHGHSFSFLVDIIGPKNGKKLTVENQCLTELYNKQKNNITIKAYNKTHKHLLTKYNDLHVFEIE